MSDGKSPENKAVARSNPIPTATVDKVLGDSIKDILSPSLQKQVLERIRPKVEMLAVTVSKFHSGPLPSVETVEGYEKLVPGSFDRIIRMAEKDQDAFIDSSKYASRSDGTFRIFCLASGLLALAMVIAGTIYLAVSSHEHAALAIAGIGSVGIITAFVNAHFGTKEPPNKA